MNKIIGTSSFSTPLGEMPWKVSKYLVILGTHTREKVEHYRTIARERKLPLHFIQLNQLAHATHAADEDTGDAILNAIQKTGPMESVINLCRTSAAYKNVLRQLCAQEGIDYNPEKILFATEDSEITIKDKAIWTHADKILRSYVPKDIMDRANMKGKGPGAETGPIAMSCGGWFALFDVFREAGRLEGKNNVYIKDRAVLTFQRLSDAQGTAISTISSTVNLCLPCAKEAPDFTNDYSTIHATRHMLAHAGNPRKCLVEDWENFLIRRSVRSRALVDLYARLENTTPEKKKIALPANILFPKSKPNGSSADYTVKYANDLSWEPIAHSDPKRDRIYNLLTPSPSLESCDALIFPPLSGMDERERLFTIYNLVSAIVSKSLEPQEANKPIIIQNDGSWNKVLGVVTYLANRGMHNDHMRPSFADYAKISFCGDVRHIQTAYLDILESKSYTAIKKATKKLVQHRKKHHRPFVALYKPLTTRQSYGTPADASKPTGTVFISASNASRHLTEPAYAYGQFLAKQNANFFWGAGDSPGKGMWAPATGYREAGGAHISGASTPTIVKIESATGRIPSWCHYSELNTNIKDRVAGMITNATTVCCFPGGVGTVEEMMEAYLVKKYLPDIGNSFSMILHSPSLWDDKRKGSKSFYQPVIENIWGRDFYESLRSDARATSEQGLYLSTSLEKTMDITRQCFESRQALRAGRGRKYDTPLGSPALL